MKAIPTVYNGVQYRSMLEARYAAWFELAHERLAGNYAKTARVFYEPEAFDGYIPDFYLTRSGQAPRVIEIKGMAELADLDKIRRSGWLGHVIVADGRGPLYAALHSPVEQFPFAVSTWTRWLETGPYVAHVVHMHSDERDVEGLFAWDFGLLDCSRFGEQFDQYSASAPGAEQQALVQALWLDAGNRVQWRSPAR